MNENKFEELLLKQLDKIDNQINDLKSEMRQGFESINTRLGTLETDVAWIKGKLEGSQEGKSSVWQIVTTATAVGAVIIALFALLK